MSRHVALAGLGCTAKQRRGRWQFTLRSLLLLVALTAAVFASLAMLHRRYEREHQAARELHKGLGLGPGYDESSTKVMRALLSLAMGKDYRPVVELCPSDVSWTGLRVFGNHCYPEIADGDLLPIRHLQSLRHLSLASCDVSDEALRPVGELENLETLYLTGEALTGRAFEHWGRLTKLRYLILEDTSVGDPSLAYLAQLTGLQELVLCDAPVSDAGMRHLSRLRALRKLCLSDLEITDKGLMHLRHTKSLREVYLEDTRVTQTGIAELKKALPGLRVEVGLVE